MTFFFCHKDPKGTRISQWDVSNLELTELGGVYIGEQVMSDYPELGSWKLVAIMRVGYQSTDFFFLN